MFYKIIKNILSKITIWDVLIFTVILGVGIFVGGLSLEEITITYIFEHLTFILLYFLLFSFPLAFLRIRKIIKKNKQANKYKIIQKELLFQPLAFFLSSICIAVFFGVMVILAIDMMLQISTSFSGGASTEKWWIWNSFVTFVTDLRFKDIVFTLLVGIGFLVSYLIDEIASGRNHSLKKMDTEMMNTLLFEVVRTGVAMIWGVFSMILVIFVKSVEIKLLVFLISYKTFRIYTHRTPYLGDDSTK